jgi:hypothetical protein
MATSKGCCHLTGAMLNMATEAADRARIGTVMGRGRLLRVEVFQCMKRPFGVRYVGRSVLVGWNHFLPLPAFSRLVGWMNEVIRDR